MIYLLLLPLSGLAFVIFVLVFHAVRSARLRAIALRAPRSTRFAHRARKSGLGLR